MGSAKNAAGAIPRRGRIAISASLAVGALAAGGLVGVAPAQATDCTGSPAPCVTSVENTTGPTTGGTHVTVTGVHLNLVTNVWFGQDSNARQGTVAPESTATNLVLITPAHVAATVPILLEDDSLPLIASPADFHFVAPPTPPPATPLSVSGKARGKGVVIFSVSKASMSRTISAYRLVGKSYVKLKVARVSANHAWSLSIKSSKGTQTFKVIASATGRSTKSATFKVKVT